MTDQIEDFGDPMDIDVPVFHYFPLLPKEIRDTIWAYTIVNIPPRMVEIRSHMTRVTQHPLFRSCLDCDIHHVFAFLAPVPAVFRVNWESRSRATATVPKEFHAILKNGPIYFDFEKDTLLFNTNATMSFFVGQSTNLDNKYRREGLMPLQLEEIQRFSKNIKYLAVRGVVDSDLHNTIRAVWRAKQIIFLDEKYRFLPWPGRLRCELDRVPAKPQTREESLRFAKAQYRLCWDATQEEAMIEGVKSPKMIKLGLATEVEQMRPTMEGEY